MVAKAHASQARQHAGRRRGQAPGRAAKRERVPAQGAPPSARPLDVGDDALADIPGEVRAEGDASLGRVGEQLGAQPLGHVDGALEQPPIVRVGPVEHRIETAQVERGVDGAVRGDGRGIGRREGAPGPDALGPQQQRAQAVLPQHHRVDGQGFDHRPRLEEVRRIETQRDTAPHVDTADIEEEPIEGLPAQVGFAQIVGQVLVVREAESVRGSQVHAAAVGETQAVADVPLLAHVKERPLSPA